MFRTRRSIDNENHIDEPEEEDEAEHIATNDLNFNIYAAQVRACRDMAEVAEMRAEFLEFGRDPDMSQAARVRARDLVALADSQIAKIKAHNDTGRPW